MTISGNRHPVPRLLWCALVACVALGGRWAVATVSGQDRAANASAPAGELTPAALAAFQEQVLPILADRCMVCHNDVEYAGDMSMEPFQKPGGVPSAEFWAKVLDKLQRGEMPPKTEPRPSPAELAAITGWIERTFDMRAMATDPETADPGRVTARRLNRTEYNNTVRDLLGVTLAPADEFPVDDSGYGFDNIGDVLTMSPMLMEKYLHAARVVARAAVFGETYPDKPSLLVQLQAKKLQDDTPATGRILPFSLRGSLYGTYHFPVDAEYEFRWRYVNFRSEENPARAGGPARGRGEGPARGRGDGPAAAGADAPARGANQGAGAPTAAGASQSPAAGQSAGANQNAGAGPNAGQTAGARAGRAGQGAGPGPGAGRRGRGAGRAPLTAEEYRAREERLRTAAPPEPMVFTIDGTPVYTYVVEGSGDFAYSHPDNVVRVTVTAGDHALRVSFPNLANVDDPSAQLNRDGRRKLFIEHMDIVGPFAPSTAPPASRSRIFVCASADDHSPACARRIVERLASRAFRRPATEQEVDRLAALVAEVGTRDGFDEGVRAAVEAILISPSFLFRVERDRAATAADANAYRIDDYELASRLSYFLWSSMPDDELFEAARTRRLREPAVLDAQVSRMLADPRAEALVDAFGEQWLNLRLMDRVKPDAHLFPKVDDELLGAMRTETRMFLSSVFREDRSILDLIDGRYTFVNGPLARYYGIPGVDGEAFRRVELDGTERSGILTQASILSVSSYATRTSPVLRGKWVLETLLGAGPPPPPPNIPALVTTDIGTAASLRQRLEQHRRDPACGACHNQTDPIGFALENYDAAGGWRTKDGNFDIDSTGTLPNGRTMAGSSGLKANLREMAPVFAEHFIDRLMTYALGRGLEKSDRPVLQAITDEVASQDYRFSAAVFAIVHSRPFQMRSRVMP